MPILKECEIFYLKADPAFPNKKYDKLNPTWEVELRTTDPAKKKEWESYGVTVKSVIPEDGDKPYYRAKVRKKFFKKDGSKSGVVEVVNGKMAPLDPNTVGNGSVANIRIFQYEYPKPDGSQGQACVLMGVQVVRLIKYERRPRDDEFGEAEYDEVDQDSEESPT
jgi:hypothetical protein